MEAASLLISEIPFAAIDFESAGLRPGGTEVPVQIGIAPMQNGVIATTDFFESFLQTDEEITWSAQKVHGIRKQDLVGAPTLTDLWPRIRTLLGESWVVAHGASTEKRFLRVFPFHGFGPWVDTLKLARAVWPTRDSFALGTLITGLGLEEELRVAHPRFRWHDALSDAIASLILLRRIVDETGIGSEEDSLLLRPNDTPYHRRKKSGR